MVGSIVHIQKLAVGIKTVDALRRRVKQRLAGKSKAHVVLTRMMPKRTDEITAGGSIYWVIAGQVRARQLIVSVQPFGNGKAKRCRITLDPAVVETECVPRKPFQGWRYLEQADAPDDLRALDDRIGLPPTFHRELADLGLL